MHRMNVLAVAAVVTLGLLAGCAVPTSTQSVTVFEGARLIVGDGRVIDNATLVVEGASITQVGRAADVRVPAGATRVNLAGKTVMPMIIDTHVHLGDTRDALIRDLRMRAYYGVSAALSMGNTDGYKLLDMRGETIPGAARFRTAGRGITMPEPGRSAVPYWVTTAAEGRKAVEELAATKSTSSRSGSTLGMASTRN
jgi:imidazolonepropionase-like amidohydrolase